MDLTRAVMLAVVLWSAVACHRCPSLELAPATHRHFAIDAAGGSKLPQRKAVASHRTPDNDNRFQSKPPMHITWPQYRGDRRLSGRSPLKGDIHRPEILWSYPVAGRETLLAVRLAPGDAKTPLPVRDSATTSGEAWDGVLMEWGAAGPYGSSWFDLDGDGKRRPWSRSYNQKVGKALPDQRGLQLIETEAKGYPKVPNTYKGTVRLKVREKGDWVTRWETETDALIWQAEPILGDFDGDGAIEIACLPWYRMHLLDAATGRIKEQCRYLAEDGSEIPGLGGRAYGWFGAVDLDRDGQSEFVIVEDFIRYCAVLGRRNGTLERLWIRVWQPRTRPNEIPDAKKAVVVRVNPEPVQDIDGDGRMEIVVSVFNQAGDDRWHVLALDSLTGETKHDLPGKFLTGARDADGDGIPELFCTSVASGTRIPEPAKLAVLSLRGGAPRTLWEQADAAFVTYSMGHFPPHINSGASAASETILCGPVAAGAPGVFFTRRAAKRPGETEITAWQPDAKGTFRAIAIWTGPRLEPLLTRAASGEAATILMKATTFDGEKAEVRTQKGAARVETLVTRRVAAPVSPVVVGRPDGEGAPIVVVQGANETIDAFRPRPGRAPERVWRAAGRGMTCNNFFEGLLLADLRGDGTTSVVAGARGEGDAARLQALSLADGTIQWTRDFEEFPGAPPPWNVPGLMYWQGGYFRDPKRVDLLVQMRRVEGETYLIDGRTGATVWRQDKGRTGRGLGRDWMALYDYDGDGLEDAFTIYPDMFCAIRGRDGHRLLAEESVRYVDQYAYYANMLVGDLLGRGDLQILYAHEAVTALFSSRGERIWKFEHPHPLDWHTTAAFGDADGDGQNEIFFPGARSESGREFQCREAATGTLRWSIPIPDERATAPMVADIDDDGRDECLFTQGRTLFAVGWKAGATSGAILWQFDLPDRAGPLTIADADGSGRAQIIVSCADGHVYGIGSLPRRP